MSSVGVLRLFTLLALAIGSTAVVAAQQPAATTREAAIELAQAEKAKVLKPFVPSKAEQVLNRIEDALVAGGPSWHPFFDNAYSGGGFTLGAGWAHHVSPYSMIDMRGSYTFKGYKRAEVEFVSPRLFHRRGKLSILGGWREATQVGFYGFGMKTSKDDRTNYLFQQPYGSATMTVWPARRDHGLMLRGGLELSRWSQRSGQGSAPSVETVYTPETLPGLGATATYLHTQGTVGYDWRPAAEYARRGGFYGVTLHDYSDRDDEFGFQQVDYEAIQHFPILREAWVISVRSRAQTTYTKSGETIPFFMLPSVGGGSSLRGFSSWRFRDRNSLLFQVEWRIMVNRFLDTAFFYDTGKVTARTSDFDLNGLKSNYGFGLRFHGPLSTPLRVELARSNESSISFVFSSSAAF